MKIRDAYLNTGDKKLTKTYRFLHEKKLRST